ncbi:MAG TPA: tetratricopeptide repeat protein, partial [Tepidisphaeraceae bacterium]|nr:tetratricopeptide repeat protein [Tepidisphaeraceae bacterium]
MTRLNPRALIVIIAAGLCALTAAIYWPVHRYGYISYDDPYYIYNNPHVQAGFTRDTVHYAFTTSTGGNWNPLLWLSFYADRALLNLRPGAMHVENVALHAVSGVLLLLLLAQLTGAIWRSAAVAALFLCHPMHVESVAWLTERKDVLSTPLLLGTMMTYVAYTRAATPARRLLSYVAMLLLFALSLMVKSMGVTLPALLLLIDFWPLRRRLSARTVLEKIPLFVIVLALLPIAMHAQVAVGATNEVLTLADRFTNAVVTYVLYAVKLIAPTGLAVFYPHPGARPAAQVVSAGLLLLLISAGAFVARHRRPYLFVGWFWFIGTLVPVIGIVQVGSQAMADRYSYLPSIGFFIAVVWFIADAIALFVRSHSPRAWTAATIATVAIASSSILCRQQLYYWRDSQAIFAHAMEVTGENWVADMHLGDIAFQRGDYATAVEYFQDVIRLRPNDARGYFDAANCITPSNPRRAIQLYREAIKRDPREPGYHVNLAVALIMIDDRAGALDEAREALRLDPNYGPAKAAVAELSAPPPPSPAAPP